MKYRLRIEVSLKPGHSDPEGETTERLLRDLSYSVDNVNISKVYRMTLDAETKSQAETKAEEICKRLLSNPTKDNYVILFEEKR